MHACMHITQLQSSQTIRHLQLFNGRLQKWSWSPFITLEAIIIPVPLIRAAWNCLQCMHHEILFFCTMPTYSYINHYRTAVLVLGTGCSTLAVLACQLV